MKFILLHFGLLIVSTFSFAQNKISGIVNLENQGLEGASVQIESLKIGQQTDDKGKYSLSDIPDGTYKVTASFVGLKSAVKTISLKNKQNTIVNFELDFDDALDEIVVSGTMRAVSRIDSPMPVDVIQNEFFLKNPTANIFEGLQTVNGVKPQINCSVCNTGDIHINGLEGPYTMVLIDGMPIVSGLSTVYGLSGIPNSLIERVEIVKGPASSLYGSEAIGGLINVITKDAFKTPRFSADIFSTSWAETNIDLGYSAKVGKWATVLTGVNAFYYDTPIDNNNDNFTDLTLQKRASVFQKWDFKRKSGKAFSLAGRYFYEDRWGGEMQWNKSYRGGDEVYGESIYTNRWEMLGNYEFNTNIPLKANFSVTHHDQNSVYGDIPYLAKQTIGFGQLIHTKTYGKHDLLLGTAFRYNYYNDNTPATASADEYWMPSIFVQDDIKLTEKQNLLLGARYDYNSNHGSIFTPRIAYRYKFTDFDVLRINAGTGFRVVNLFTEDHAALTGSRDVIIANELKPEQSYNVNLNYLKKIYGDSGNYYSFEASTWYTHFTNQIIPDYDTHPNQIIYDNLDGYAVSKGISLNADATLTNGLKLMLGVTAMDVNKTENSQTTRQMLTERFTGTWSIAYDIPKTNLTIDYTGNLYGGMRLPTLGELDPRRDHSKPFSIQNIQVTYKGLANFEFYGGVKNLLNWTVNKGNPFVIARANDPFDRGVDFDNNGNAIATPSNPYALTFDPSYSYGTNQGIRGFVGVRYNLK
nr:TonB-dependent receptor [uncultured Flavobacterium sp.]